MYDCDHLEDLDSDGSCWDDCYLDFNVDKAAWDAKAAEYADYTEEEILGNEWHTCYFDTSCDATAAIAEAEAACGAQQGDDIAKTSGAVVVTASIGMIATALVAIW